MKSKSGYITESCIPGLAEGNTTEITLFLSMDSRSIRQNLHQRRPRLRQRRQAAPVEVETVMRAQFRGRATCAGRAISRTGVPSRATTGSGQAALRSGVLCSRAGKRRVIPNVWQPPMQLPEKRE